MSNQDFFETLSLKQSGVKKQKLAILSQSGTGLIIGLLGAVIPALVSLLAR